MALSSESNTRVRKILAKGGGEEGTYFRKGIMEKILRNACFL